MVPTSLSGLGSSEAKVGRRNLKGDRREQAILEGAYELLRTVPLRSVSIDDLAKRAGLSRSSFYFYYESKWQVLSALLSRVTSEVYSASQLIFERPTGMSPDAAIEHAISEVIQVWEQHGHVLREVGDAAAAEAELQAQWDTILGRFIDAAAAGIERDRASGVALDGPPARSLAAALMWMGERNLALMSSRSENAIPMEDMVETVTTIWLRTVYGLEWKPR
ncbi:TetR/AcrR family transcriptional regulator [Rhodococcus fascians]|nr:TetR/AcrR family transcriptional regulator [Rhodococcus fascians]MBY4238671.1 TetR/AcrR family transcriptional regulator [Rhodococcus fascians]MBY4254740.1 TetR/AcrR family transcriptional regulator [Rhodococcus fascians]MBY4270026.1 TetR/AcrR family transcriptional regulator [Rhodococcus fascians]